MKPTDWMSRTMRRSISWIAGALCCLPLMASPEEDADAAEKARSKAIREQMIKNGKEETKATTAKLKERIIPHVSFKDASIEDVAASLSKTLEDILPPIRIGATGEPRPAIWVRTSYGYKPTPVTVEMKNESAEKVLNEVARQAGMYARVSLTMVTIWPTKENWEKAKAEKEQAAAASAGNDAGAAGGAEGEMSAKEISDQMLKNGEVKTKDTTAKLREKIIPSVSFKDASIDDVAASLSKTLEGILPIRKVGDTDQTRPGIWVSKGYGYKPTPVTVDLKDATAEKVLATVADRAGMLHKVVMNMVVIFPKPAEKTEEEKAAAGEEAGGGTTNASSGGQDVSGSFLVAMKGVVDLFFKWIWAATVRASVIGGVILALQFLLGRIIPARWRYALWAPMVLVLVLPVLPEVPFGLFPAKPAVISSEMVATPAATPEVSVASAAPVTAMAAQGTQRVILNPYALVWLGGVLGMLAFGISSYRRNLRRIVGKQVAANEELMCSIKQSASEVKLRKLPRVIVSTAVETPAVAGLLRPALLLPVDFMTAFTAAEARLVLVHELTHLKRHDLLVNWLCCVIQALHWFNPILWFAFARMRDDRESACDDQVLSLDGKDHRSTYGHALLKLQASPVSPALHLGFVGIFERNAGLKSRIREIGRHRKVHPAYHAVGVSLLAALLAFGTTKAQEAKPKTQTKPRPTETAKAKAVDPAKVAIEKKLDSIMLPIVQVKDSSLEEVIDFLRIRSKELDPETDTTKKGLNFVIRKPRTGSNEEDPGTKRVTLDLKDVSMRKVFEGICAQTGLQYKVDEFAVTFVPAGEAPGPTDPVAPPSVRPSGKAIEAAKKVIIPVVDFQDVTLGQAVDFLKLRSTQLSPDKKEVTIQLKASAKKDAVIPMLRLANLPMSEAVRYIAEAVKQPWGADDESIWIGKD